MSDISINGGNVESVVSELVSRIQTDIIDASVASGNTIITAVENSLGDFKDALIDDVSSEVALVGSIGELLIEMVNFVQSAANTFTYVDQAYDIPMA